ncbi:MAG: TolC family outer membrane protein [Pseudomonadota bacterium]|nr:TolC family outer membrane protein [Pseudomonadota bacterium]
MFFSTVSALKQTSRISLIYGLLLTPLVVNSATTVDQAVKQAIEKNPEVQASWHNFLSSKENTSQASSEYGPTLDFYADYSWQNKDYIENESFDGASAKLLFSQMLYDGSRTKNNVKLFKNDELVSYFGVLGSVEKTALEAYIAYQDVLRYRELVRLAQQNYDSHMQVYKKIVSGVETGHTRRADLEQINGRLALAKSNLLTEKANLHDVSSRYLRIIGLTPSKEMQKADLQTEILPNTFHDVMNNAYLHNPNFHAAIRNIRSKQSKVDTERSDLYPRLDLTAQYGGQTYDLQGLDNAQRDGRVALEFRYNLYNGDRTNSAIRGAKEEVSRAIYLREKACIDMRQTLQIAYNDVKKISDQLPILEQHRNASNKVRVAFNDQFSINKRTLLDLLDTEIEYFQSSRAFSNAHYDRNISVAKTLAEMGSLLSYLKVSRGDLPSLSDLGAEPMAIDPETTCPTADMPDLGMDIEEPKPVVMPNKFAAPDQNNLEGNTYRLEIKFTKNSAIIDSKYGSDIAELARFMKDNPNTLIEIRGHASLEGPEAYNQDLSERRAKAVVNELITKHKINPDRLNAIGFGETKPLINNMTWAAHKANRRIESNIKNAPQAE